MKILFIILIIILAVFAVRYIGRFYTQKPQCPEGSRFVRKVQGGGWADTDATDPWGSCVSGSVIDAANNP